MTYAPAPFWRRLAARSIDLLICLPLTFVAVIPVVLVILPLSLVLSDDAASSLGAFLCFLIAYSLVEYFLLRRRSGQTLGKGLMGLRVVPAYRPAAGLDATAQDAGQNEAISARAAILRISVLIGPALASAAFYYIGYEDSPSYDGGPVDSALIGLWFSLLAVSALLALVERRRRRTLHDFASGTIVVRTERRGVSFKQDFRMLVPGKVSLEKRPTPAPVLLAK